MTELFKLLEVSNQAIVLSWVYLKLIVIKAETQIVPRRIYLVKSDIRTKFNLFLGFQKRDSVITSYVVPDVAEQCTMCDNIIFTTCRSNRII